MFYLKAGIAWAGAKATYMGAFEYEYPGGAKSKFPSTYATVRCIKLAPLVAIGMEKPCQDGFRARFEIEYRFNVSKKYNYITTTTVNVTGTCDRTIEVTNKEAITLRAMAVFPM